MRLHNFADQEKPEARSPLPAGVGSAVIALEYLFLIGRSDSDSVISHSAAYGILQDPLISSDRLV